MSTRATSFVSVASLVLACATGPGCAIHALGRAPADVDLRNDGSSGQQSELLKKYEVVYERGTVRRPGVEPDAVGAEIHADVDDASAPAWSDDAWNYLSSSTGSAEVLDSQLVAFDEFAHSGTGELVLVGTGAGVGLVGGAVAWFIETTVRDGVSVEETTDLQVRSGGGLFAGVALGAVVALAYTYVVPALSSPLAAPLYREAVRAFNDDLSERIADNAPSVQVDDGDVGAAPAGDAAPIADVPSANTAPPNAPQAGASEPPAGPRPVEAPATP